MPPMTDPLRAARSWQRVADHRRMRDSDRGEQRVRVPDELLETVLVMRRLARFAEANLIGGGDAVSNIIQHRDGRVPGRSAETLAVQ